MNIFRLAGDLMHLASIIILLLKIQHTRSCAGVSLSYVRLLANDTLGISLKTQVLYAVVFITRYLDLLTNYVSLYNFIMKVIFIGGLSRLWRRLLISRLFSVHCLPHVVQVPCNI